MVRQPPGVYGQASTSVLFSSIIALHTSLTTSEIVLCGALQPFIEAYLFPEARWRRVRESFRPGSRGSLYRACILGILGQTLSSSSSNMSGGMRRKLVNDAGSSIRSSIISWSYIPNSCHLPIYGLTQIALLRWTHLLLILLARNSTESIMWFWCLKWLFCTLFVASQILPCLLLTSRVIVCSSVSTLYSWAPERWRIRYPYVINTFNTFYIRFQYVE